VTELDGTLTPRDLMRARKQGRTQFYDDQKTGRFPPPDFYLGPRSPRWLESTYRRWLAQKLAEPKQAPMQTPRRKRKVA
jgi:predicted DNA-binding transcriptional regulator AlpA